MKLFKITSDWYGEPVPEGYRPFYVRVGEALPAEGKVYRPDCPHEQQFAVLGSSWPKWYRDANPGVRLLDRRVCGCVGFVVKGLK